MFRRSLVVILGVFGAQASAADHPYTLLAPVASEKLGCWADHYDGFGEIVGYSHLGHFFLRTGEGGEYLVLHPLMQAAKSYGDFPSVETFEAQVLQEPGFMEHVLRPSHVASIRKRLGGLGKDEIYIPTPYPFLGGSGEPESYEKGDMWVFMDIVSQLLDVCADSTAEHNR